MFLDIEAKNASAVAAIDELGQVITYGNLVDFTNNWKSVIPDRVLVFILCENVPAALKGYVACMSNGVVPLLLDAAIDQEMLDGLINTYSPAYLWMPKERAESSGQYESVYEHETYVLLATGMEQAEMFPELGLLLTTSGSTGTAKLVRQSYANILSNAESIAEYLQLTKEERPITNLPMSYTYGLSVINSHLLVGATILLTTKSVFQKEFWEFFRKEEATSIAGVPYTYEMLKRIRFFRMDLPSLKTMTQAGGKLSPELHKEYAEFAQSHGIRFFVMYGQTEATARMSYLPYEKAVEKYGSMGIAIPGGRFYIIDVNGEEIHEPDVMGELVYEGPNVTLGYAESRSDLIKGDERGGKLVTGDMAKVDSDGYYYIVGRKKRFLKIFGKRVNLDETERMIKQQFDVQCACSGRDDLMYVFLLDEGIVQDVKEFLSKKMNIHHSAFKTVVIDEIPINESGKIQYKELPIE